MRACAAIEVSDAPDHVYVIGLGGNQGDVRETLLSARKRMAALPGTRVLACSPLYLSAAMGPPQPDFLNAACRLRSTLEPFALLQELHRIEHAQGRVRTQRWGPRTLDLDILWSDTPLTTPELTVPHAGLTERWWAMRPLLDVAPELTPQYGPLLRRLGPTPAPVGTL